MNMKTQFSKEKKNFDFNHAIDLYIEGHKEKNVDDAREYLYDNIMQIIDQ